jgi:hypothetical protein
MLEKRGRSIRTFLFSVSDAIENKYKIKIKENPHP